MTVEVDGRKFKYLQGGQPVPVRGQKIEITGMPMVGLTGHTGRLPRFCIHSGLSDVARHRRRR